MGETRGLKVRKGALATCGNAEAETRESGMIDERLRPCEKFAAMIERHRRGIAAYCRPENKVALLLTRGATCG